MSKRIVVNVPSGANRTRKQKSKRRFFRSFGSPYPISADVEFKYVDRISMDAGGSGAVAQYQFTCNGMYDPDVTGTGHQPIGFDQWMGTSSTTGFYNHYHVEASEIKITAFSQASDNTGQAIVLLGISDDTTTGIDFNTALENPSFDRITLGSVGSGHDVQTLKKKWNACRYFGLTRESLYAKDDLKGIYSANPAELANFTLYVSSDNPTVNPSAVSLLVEVKYRAHLTERKELLGS